MVYARPFASVRRQRYVFLAARHVHGRHALYFAPRVMRGRENLERANAVSTGMGAVGAAILLVGLVVLIAAALRSNPGAAPAE